MMHKVVIERQIFSNDRPFGLIAGPCQIESLDHSLKIARALASLCQSLGIKFVFKSSYDKANRTSLTGIRGPGIMKGLEILAEVKKEVNCPVITDVHTAEQCAIAAEYVDMLQIPAFLCRQTDLLIAAGQTGLPVNVKKGQFMAPWDMTPVIEKIASTGNQDILLCERGTVFGYNNLISDMRSLPILAATGYPVIIDATHSVQLPGGQGSSSGGQREYAQVIARASVAVGVAGVFLEVHENPDQAPSDGPNMLCLDELEDVLVTLIKIDHVTKSDSRFKQ